MRYYLNYKGDQINTNHHDCGYLLKKTIEVNFLNLTLFRSISVLCGTDDILHNIPHTETECEKHSTEYCQSQITLQWI